MAASRTPSAAPAPRLAPSGQSAGRPRAGSRTATLTFVTGNAGKVRELAAQLRPLGIDVVADGRGYTEIQAGSLEEVARAGAAELLAAGLKPPFILEDSGLFVSALKGFPGVFSRHALDTLGCAGLLRLMGDVEHELRTAHFETCLVLVDAAGAVHAFTGRCVGRITERAAGTNGFGFDPVFAPKGESRTFGEMDLAEKAAHSHRAKAVRLLLAHLAAGS